MVWRKTWEIAATHRELVLAAAFVGITRGSPTGRSGARFRWSYATAKKYVQRVLEKLAVTDRTQAAVEAVKRGLLR